MIDFIYVLEYVFCGVEVVGNFFQFLIEVFVDDVYVGFWINNLVIDGEFNEIDIYVGYKYKFSEVFLFEVVGIYYWYFEVFGGVMKNFWEVGFGVIYIY